MLTDDDTSERIDRLVTGDAAGARREMLAEVGAVQRISDDLRLISLDLVRPLRFDFAPGQYVEVQVPGTDEHRLYSIASPPGPASLDLLVHLVPGGLFSGYVAERLRPGSELRLSGPYGSCALRDDDRPLLLVGQGGGMAPLLSILGHLARTGTARPVTLMMGGATEADLFLSEHLDLLGALIPGLRTVLSLTRPGPAWTGRRGPITDHVAALGVAAGGLEAHIGGPPDMVERAVASLRRLGVALADIAYEPFSSTHRGQRVMASPAA